VRGRKCHPQLAGQQQHHRRGRVRALGDVLGVAGKGDTGLVEQALLYRRGHHRAEFSGQAAIDRAIDQRQYCRGVGAVEPSRDAGCSERLVQQSHRSRGPLDRSASFIVTQHELESEQPRALLEERAITQAHQRPLARLRGGRQAQIGPDAGWFPRGQRDRRRWPQSRSST
jgi:hypothetical protein